MKKMTIQMVFGLLCLCLVGPTINLHAQIDWTLVGSEPVLDYGAPGEWDDNWAFAPSIIQDGDTLKMWYSGLNEAIVEFRIGYAWSINGQTWDRYPSNPVLTPEYNWESASLSGCVVIKDEDSLKMWYGAGGGSKPGNKVGYATSIDGIHWKKHPEMVLQTGGMGEWDSSILVPESVIRDDGVYKMWYWGGLGGWPSSTIQIGMAISSDGINWTKHDDPTTTEAPFVESDPVLKVGKPNSWDGLRAFSPSILKTDWGYEMLYAGKKDLTNSNNQWIGYATSLDGTLWQKWPTNPVLHNSPAWGYDYMPSSVLFFDDFYHMWYSGFNAGGQRPRIGYAKSRILDPIIEIDSHLVFDGSGNQNGVADPGEDVTLQISLINKGGLISNVAATISSNDPDIQITQNTSMFDEMARYESANNEQTPFSFTVMPNAIPHASTFYIELSGTPEYTSIDSFKVNIGTTQILLVDDDGGNNYEQYYADLVFADTWQIDKSGVPPPEDINSYKAVIWFTGDERENTLSPDEQMTIANYVNNGGRLLLTGQDIGYDLVENGSIQDSLFYNNVLKCQYVADNSNTPIIDGISTDTLTNDQSLWLINMYGGDDYEKSPDVILPIGPATGMLKYSAPEPNIAAVRYENPQNFSCIVYLAFGFEGIGGPEANSASTFMETIVGWLLEPSPFTDRTTIVDVNGSGDFTSIQKGINSSTSGDTVKVMRGIYYENLNFRGKNIYLTSIDGPKITIINGRKPQNPDSGSVVCFISGESSDAVLHGFTIKGGTGTIKSGVGKIGGGIWCLNSSPTIEENIIRDNVSSDGGGLEISRSSNPIIKYNIIWRNKAFTTNPAFLSLGGGIGTVNGAKPLILNNTIVGNECLTGAGGVSSLFRGTNPVLRNNIIAGNNDGGIMRYQSGTATISYCNVFDNPGTHGNYYGVSPGDGCVSADPMFIDAANGDFRLAGDSPCIDAGDPNDLDPDGSIRDLGAVFPPGPITLVNKSGILAKKFNLFQNHPNPFNPSTNISYQISKLSQVRLYIFDVIGREIKIIIDKQQPPGEYSILWDGRDEDQNQMPSGVYFVKLKADDLTIVRKMLLVR
jgi:hypothetical protein